MIRFYLDVMLYYLLGNAHSPLQGLVSVLSLSLSGDIASRYRDGGGRRSATEQRIRCPQNEVQSRNFTLIAHFIVDEDSIKLKLHQANVIPLFFRV